MATRCWTAPAGGTCRASWLATAAVIWEMACPAVIDGIVGPRRPSPFSAGQRSSQTGRKAAEAPWRTPPPGRHQLLLSAALGWDLVAEELSLPEIHHLGGRGCQPTEPRSGWRDSGGKQRLCPFSDRHTPLWTRAGRH